jgi:hypothetical protein
VIELRGYVDESGHKRFADWIEQLEHVDAAKINRGIGSLGTGKRGNKKTPAARRRRRHKVLGGVQTKKETGNPIMPLTHDFKETIRARAQRDSAFRLALLRESVECILNGDLETGKLVLRDYVNATVGFQNLERHTRIPIKSLMRMLGPKGSPSVANFTNILAALQKNEGVHFKLSLRR